MKDAQKKEEGKGSEVGSETGRRIFQFYPRLPAHRTAGADPGGDLTNDK